MLFLPSFWLVVPGSLGLVSVAQVNAAGASATELTGVAGLMLAIAVGMVLGTGTARMMRRAVHGVRSARA
ncbi:MAG: hypothetical protein ACK5MT_01030 [Actinomycetales bacterium]